MNINRVFSGNYLKAEDLQGRPARVTIAAVEIKDFDDGKKIILQFQGKDKSLVCNKTNASIIAENVGSPDTDAWIGQTIILTVKKVEFQGNLVPAIRVALNDTAPAAVHPTAPPAAPKPAPVIADDPDSVPF